MKATDFLICLLKASGGRIQGRTLLQKRAFFVSILTKDDLGVQFSPHYYGPFSPSLDSALSQLKSLGFVEELTLGFGMVNEGGFEVKRYDYRLTDDGEKIAALIVKNRSEEYKKVANSLKLLQRAGDPGYFELSIAAKAYFVLHAKGTPMTRDEIVREAKSFDWKIQPESLEKAVSFLQKLQLAQSA
jgi:uncharacterized protein YwgA